MKTQSGNMSKQSKQEYLENARTRYSRRNRHGKGAMISELCDTFGWTRKHAIKALNRKVTLGCKSQKRGRKATYGEKEKSVIITIWKSSEQPCGILLKATIPLWLKGYEVNHGKLNAQTRRKVLRCSRVALSNLIGSLARIK